MKNICIIGAGNIGSRHLQGLKNVTIPLNIEVVDPSVESLNISRQRYDQISTSTNHKVSFLQNINKISKNIDLAIIATNSNVRRNITENLLSTSSVKYLILEKILFQKREDYLEIEKLLKKKGCKTWVNFSMRTMPFYYDLKHQLNEKIHMIVSGSQYGLITNTIHYIDYIAFLTNCYDFTVETKGLDNSLIESKRSGFLELNGSLNVFFKDGSMGTFTCYPNGDTPYIIEVLSKTYRCISKESERKAYISSAKSKWNWEETDTDIPHQSDMSNLVAEEILKTGKSILTPYDQASKLHLQLLESLLKFISSAKKKYDIYPFT